MNYSPRAVLSLLYLPELTYSCLNLELFAYYKPLAECFDCSLQLAFIRASKE